MGCTYAKLQSFVDKNLSRYKTATRKKNLSHIVNAGKFLDLQYKLINILLFIGCLRPLLLLNLKRRWWKQTLLSARLGFMPKKGCNYYLNQTHAFQAYPNSSVKPSKPWQLLLWSLLFSLFSWTIISQHHLSTMGLLYFWQISQILPTRLQLFKSPITLSCG